MTTEDLVARFNRYRLCAQICDGPARVVWMLGMMMCYAADRREIFDLPPEWGWPAIGVKESK